MKTCTKCGDEKSLECFTNELRRKDGKYPWCKECTSKHKKARYVAIPRKVWIEQKVCSKCKEWKPREEYRKYAGNNLHYRCISCEDNDAYLTSQNLCECSSCNVVKPYDQFYKSLLKKTSKQCIDCHKAYHKQEDIAKRRRDQNLQKYFGITLEDYKNLLEEQEGKCPICLEPFEVGKYSYPVDHAHNGPNAGVIRAILHDKCNRFVMWKHTDPEQLRRAADLIESPLTSWYVPEEFVKTRKIKKSGRTKAKPKT